MVNVWYITCHKFFILPTEYIYVCYDSQNVDRLCDLVVRISGYKSRGPSSIPLSLMSTIEELLVRESSGSGLESREYCRRDQLR
jgi:hypothetical protein